MSYFSEGLDLRAGQQIIPWGKSDGVNPTDYFTAKNYTFLNPDDEVKRTGAPALNFTFTPDNGTSPLSFQLVFQAFYPQTALLIPTQIIPQGMSINLYPNSPSAFQANSMEYGAKLSYQKSNYDFSISAFKGFGAVPEFVLNTSTLSIRPINPGERAFGADASVTRGDWILRFESALHLPDNGSPSDPLFGYVEPDHWDTVIGIERPLFTDFRLQAQFLYRYHLYFDGNPIPNASSPVLNTVLKGIASANATLLNYQHQGNPGTTLRIAYQKDGSRFSADLFFVGYFGGGDDFLIRPQAGFAPVDNVKLLAGFDYYGGNPARPLGALHGDSDGFFEARLLF